jgi:CHAD domain-containing protein
MAKAHKIQYLNPTQPLNICLRKILRVRFAEMISYEQGTLEGNDSEALHDMRVASRRLQAMLKIFSGAFNKKKFKNEYLQVRTLISALGEVRNYDVFIEKLEKYKTGTEPKDLKALELLIARQKALRSQKRKTLVQSINYLNRIRYKENIELFVETALKES